MTSWGHAPQEKHRPQPQAQKQGVTSWAVTVTLDLVMSGCLAAQGPAHHDVVGVLAHRDLGHGTCRDAIDVGARLAQSQVLDGMECMQVVVKLDGVTLHWPAAQKDSPQTQSKKK